MLFSKCKLVVCLGSLLIAITILAACNKVSNVDTPTIDVDNTSAIFGVDDLNNALVTTVSESIELPSVDFK